MPLLFHITLYLKKRNLCSSRLQRGLLHCRHDSGSIEIVGYTLLFTTQTCLYVATDKKKLYEYRIRAVAQVLVLICRIYV